VRSVYLQSCHYDTLPLVFRWKVALNSTGKDNPHDHTVFHLVAKRGIIAVSGGHFGSPPVWAIKRAIHVRPLDHPHSWLLLTSFEPAFSLRH
jgi:hypothetical protein